MDFVIILPGFLRWCEMDCATIHSMGGCPNQWHPILVGRCTTHFRTYFSGDWDVHWGLTGVLTHSHMAVGQKGTQNGTLLMEPKTKACGPLVVYF